jgi:uncharacterized membrane protein YbhN (UPF0104 family)
MSKKPAPWRRFYYLNMTTRALGLFIPHSLSTFAGKPVALRALGIPIKQAIWIVLMDNTFDLMLLSTLTIPGLLFLSDRISLVTFVVLILVFILILTGWLWWIISSEHLNSLIKRLGHMPRVTSLLHLDSDIINASLPTFSTTLKVLGLTVLLNGALATRFYYIAHAVEVPYPWPFFAASYPVAQLSLVLALLPGGLGIFEAGWYGMLLLGGVPKQSVLTFVIAQRAYIFIFVLIWAGVSTLLSLTVKEQERA